MIQKTHSRDRWEITPAQHIQIQDLDPEEILRTSRLGKEAGRLPETLTPDVRDILNRLGVLSDEKPLHASVVLFGTKFTPYYSQCVIRLARFRGDSKTEFLDHRQVHGNAFQLLSEAMNFIERHLPVAGKISSLERTDTPLFPREALREAVVNAICHREYSNPGGSISLAIYDHRLEVWSTGKLPFGLSVEKLKKDHSSTPRNPTIAGVFYKRGLVENWGRGTQRIIELCAQAGLPEPEFAEEAGSVVVRFFTIASPRVEYDNELPALQNELLTILSKTGELPLREIIKKLKLPPAERTIREHLGHLKKAKKIDSKGRGKSSLWFIRRNKADCPNTCNCAREGGC